MVEIASITLSKDNNADRAAKDLIEKFNIPENNIINFQLVNSGGGWTLYCFYRIYNMHGRPLDGLDELG